jgi:uncharacterized protein (UPF0332 family)
MDSLAKDKKALSQYRLDMSKECISSALLELNAGQYKASTNRVYYAMFHAIRSVLALDGVDYKKHSAVISYFRQNYIKTGIFNKKYSDIIKLSFNTRMDADYEDFYVVSKEEAKEQIEETVEFISAIENVIENHETKN